LKIFIMLLVPTFTKSDVVLASHCNKAGEVGYVDHMTSFGIIKH